MTPIMLMPSRSVTACSRRAGQMGGTEKTEDGTSKTGISAVWRYSPARITSLAKLPNLLFRSAPPR